MVVEVLGPARPHTVEQLTWTFVDMSETGALALM